MNDKLTILLCDDHPIVRSGLAALLELHDDLEVVGQASDGEQAVRLAAELQPDVIVMDVSMPKVSGVDATTQIKAARPDARILALTAHDDNDYVHLLLKAGASGYVLKKTAAEDLVRAIHAVARGGVYVDPSMAEHLVSSLRGGSRSSGGANARPELSDREAEVLRFIAEGHAMKEVAAKLDLSTRTLETYKARAMEKLGFTGRADIVKYALQRGWLKSV